MTTIITLSLRKNNHYILEGVDELARFYKKSRSEYIMYALEAHLNETRKRGWVWKDGEHIPYPFTLNPQAQIQK